MVEEEATAGVHQEIEWQFEAEDLGPVEGWASRMATGPVEVKRLRDRYFDTEHWHLYRSGYALRLRRRGKRVEAGLKTLDLPWNNLHHRRELSEDFKGEDAAGLSGSGGPVGRMVRRVCGGRGLTELFEVRTRRRSFPLEIDGLSAELSLDETLIVPAGEGGRRASMLRVELELRQKPTSLVEEFVARMADELGLRPVSLSKYEEGLAAGGLVPGAEAEFGATGVDVGQSLPEMAYAVMRRQFSRMLSHEAGTRLGEDPEELHDMRVASRRLRSALRLFSGALPEEVAAQEPELKWVAGALGEVRDLDVHLAELEGLMETATEEEKSALEEIVGVVRQRRGAARGRMLQVLDSDRYRDFEERFSALLRQGASGEDRRPVSEAAPEILGKRYGKVQRAAGRLGEASTVEEFHGLRKKAKRLRYALEFFEDAYGDQVRKPIKRLKELQDELGRHQDLVVAGEHLRGLATGAGLSRQTLFYLGVFVERYHREAALRRVKILGSRALRRFVKGKGRKTLRKL